MPPGLELRESGPVTTADCSILTTGKGRCPDLYAVSGSPGQRRGVPPSMRKSTRSCGDGRDVFVLSFGEVRRKDWLMLPVTLCTMSPVAGAEARVRVKCMSPPTVRCGDASVMRYGPVSSLKPSMRSLRTDVSPSL